ncbi:uncharacterized protein LAESUDRAFT_445568 [Laetiporus sulphureus 93-53]|uniref:DUF6534 domain-containing protein n=1 Tax=Laetiporus sulphureus 93-53 TaxID=1314785 RepID=A0A165C141_9APHY|nr:uncharacterized protein LAESUDRAFT_445568 [Laetiporus sulphureus 93-53]KZT02010.1 hypothetical protein LAESUDRAFT_445568 [Laetiporus sulphureus 93-53]
MSTTIEKFVGAFLITICVAMVFYGMSTIQAYVYWWNYPNDPLKIKIVVAVIWLLETLHSVFCLHVVYSYLIIDFGDLAKVEQIVWSAPIPVLIAVLIAAIVQGFFIHRLWILSAKNRFLTSVATTLLFLRVGTGIGTVTLSWEILEWATFRTALGPLITLTWGVSLAAAEDIIIAVSLIYYLQKSHGRTRSTDHLIRTLQTYTINTGSLTMLTSIVILMTFVFYKGSLIFMGMVSIQGKLYANSFLATLNARHHLNSPRGTVADDAITMSFAAARIPPRRLSETPTSTLPLPPHIQIYQTVTKATHNDVAEAGVVDLNSTHTPTNSNVDVENADDRKVQMFA